MQLSNTIFYKSANPTRKNSLIRCHSELAELPQILIQTINMHSTNYNKYKATRKNPTVVGFNTALFDTKKHDKIINHI